MLCRSFCATQSRRMRYAIDEYHANSAAMLRRDMFDGASAA